MPVAAIFMHLVFQVIVYNVHVSICMKFTTTMDVGCWVSEDTY